MGEVAREKGELLSDEELMRRAMASPVVQARIAEVQAELKERKGPRPPGLTTEELVEFLRELG